MEAWWRCGAVVMGDTLASRDDAYFSSRSKTYHGKTLSFEMNFKVKLRLKLWRPQLALSMPSTYYVL
jgi:hypothetical protein